MRFMGKHGITILSVLVIATLFLWPTREKMPGVLEQITERAERDITIAYIRDSVCIMCPDGEIAFEIAADPDNVLFVGEDWTQVDMDNLTRSLEPACDVRVSTPDLVAFLMRHGDRRGEVWTFQLEAD